MHGGTANNNDAQKIKANIETLKLRVKALRGSVDGSEMQRGRFFDTGFIPLLQETLTMINESDCLTPDLNIDIRRFLAELSRYHILPACAVWPRRYLYEKTYRRVWEKPEYRFIYKAFDALYRRKGFSGWQDPLVEDTRKEFEETFKKFFSIRLSTEWDIENETYRESPLSLENESALELGKMFVRLFYVEGLAAELLDAWKSYESFIYLTPHYRDHFLHLIYDFLLGCKIFDDLMPRIYENWKYYTDTDISFDELRIRIMRAWVIASLFHDTGYAAQTLETLQSTLQKTFFSKVPGLTLTSLRLQKERYIIEELNDFLIMLSFTYTEDEFSFDFERLKEFKEKRYYPESLIFGAINSLFADQVAKLDHGVMSALFLLLTLKVDIHEFTMDANKSIPFKERVANYRRERSELLEDVVSSALAISLHNMRQDDYRGLTVDFRSHPISFMLMLCDQLHEWDRRSNMSRRDEPFRAIYGFEVFRVASDPKAIFEDKTTLRTLEGESYAGDSFLYYLKSRIRTVNGRSVDVNVKLRPLIPVIMGLMDGWKGRDNHYIQLSLKRWIEKEISDYETALILRTLFMNLTNDIVTLIYVGGRERTRGEEGDRIGRVWSGLYDMYFKNLSYGPAACFLHGYDEDRVELFFTAEYSVPSKMYRVEESLKPKAYRL